MDENQSHYLLDDDDEAIGLLEEETGIRDLTLEVLTRHLVEDERCRVGRLRRPRDDIRAFRLCDRLQVGASIEIHRYRGIVNVQLNVPVNRDRFSVEPSIIVMFSPLTFCGVKVPYI